MICLFLVRAQQQATAQLQSQTLNITNNLSTPAAMTSSSAAQQQQPSRSIANRLTDSQNQDECGQLPRRQSKRNKDDNLCREHSNEYLANARNRAVAATVATNNVQSRVGRPRNELRNAAATATTAAGVL